MPNDAKHHASVLACKDTQLGDSDAYTILASERVDGGTNLFFTIITDPLRGSNRPMFLSPRCAQSLCDFRLHGVSHNAASPMPEVSNTIKTTNDFQPKRRDMPSACFNRTR
mgnify:CR=1